MNVGSTFSGVGGFDLGFERAGMRVLWQAEVDEWCRRVLRWHWPDAAINDDVCAVGSGSYDEGKRGDAGSVGPGKAAGGRCESGGAIDLLCGGFPCQDLSVAGKRAGFKGERSSLFFEFARIADELRPRWIVLENVVGLLSSAEGRDFGILLATLAEIGYGCAWRVVDARYFGVPQRRRRVFIVGCLGDDGGRAVRALGAGGEGNLEAGECSWQGASPPPTGSVGGVGGVITEPTAKCLTTSNERLDSETESFVVRPAATGFHRTQTPISEHEGSLALGVTSGGMAVSFEPSTVSFELGHTKGNGSGVNTTGVAYTLDRAAGQGVLAPAIQASGPPGSRRDDEQSLVASTLAGSPGRGYRIDAESAAGNHLQVVGPSVRRLTPTECERLMGWPDGWTAVDGDKTPDGRRYAACGNGVVANVSEWIGRRIMAIERES